MYTIKNSFHNSEAKTKYSPGERADESRKYVDAAYAQAMRRAHDKLCGVSDCTCGNAWGERV